jgi:UDP-2-acetamido-2,6-beta-L-arabino-hexul-4-ose reductase
MPDQIITITGATGLLGSALAAHLAFRPGTRVVPIGRASGDEDRRAAIMSADRILHLAGVTRPSDPTEFASGNVGVTEQLAELVERGARATPLAFASSIRATETTPYGRTKRIAEEALIRLAERTGAPLAIFRLPSFFGAWSRPHYNSAVATFCHEVAHGRPPSVRAPDAPLTLVHLDDVVRAFLDWIDSPAPAVTFHRVEPSYTATVGQVAELIQGFADRGIDDPPIDLADGLIRGLHQTYLAHLKP